MSDIYKPVDGDRVRVVYEGIVEDADSDGFRIGNSVPILFKEDEYALVSVEKIEPPVETFKPGDVVRDKFSGSAYAIGVDSYIYLPTGKVYGKGLFTSEHYEKVSLG